MCLTTNLFQTCFRLNLAKGWGPFAARRGLLNDLPGTLVSWESPELFSFCLHTPQVYRCPTLGVILGCAVLSPDSWNVETI